MHAALLKGFVKTAVLAPTAGGGPDGPPSSQDVTFKLTRRDRSYYDAAAARWVLVDGKELEASIGASSADIRQRCVLDVDAE